MFGFIKDVFDSTVGKVVNTIGKGVGDMLRSVGLEGVISSLASTLGSIPGFGGTLGGLLKMVPKLLKGKIDLQDALKIGAFFLPPPAGAIASMADLTSLTGAIANQVGGVDPNSAGGSNLLSLVQKFAFDFAGKELAAN